MNSVWEGFLKAANLTSEVVEELPKILSATNSPDQTQKPKKRKGFLAWLGLGKSASGDMVNSPENHRAYERRVDMGLQSGEKWKRYKRERRSLIGLGRDVVPPSGSHDDQHAENATPTKADSGTTPGTGGMP